MNWQTLSAVVLGIEAVVIFIVVAMLWHDANPFYFGSRKLIDRSVRMIEQFDEVDR